MSALNEFLYQSESFEQYMDHYFSHLYKLLSNLDKSSIKAFLQEIDEARAAGNTIFILGNGGSAATASHMGNDIGLAAHKVGKGGKPYRVMALTDNLSILTAIGNDDGYEEIFLKQLNIHYREGDKIVVISASGNSPNLVVAAQWVKNKGGKVLGFLGFDGGKLKDLCDTAIVAETPKGEYGPVEDVHMILDHLITCWLYRKLGEE